MPIEWAQFYFVLGLPRRRSTFPDVRSGDDSSPARRRHPNEMQSNLMEEDILALVDGLNSAQKVQGSRAVAEVASAD